VISRLLASLLPHLEVAAEAAPEGRTRWYCLCTLADARRRSGSPDASLPFCERAAAQARSAAEAEEANECYAWSDVAAITGHWANALVMTGNLDAARQRHLDSAVVYKKAGRPAVYVIGRELEALRIDIMQGRAAEVLPHVEARLAQVETWWQQYRDG
jgi:hypothetical protein